jgi:hypothetical protein
MPTQKKNMHQALERIGPRIISFLADTGKPVNKEYILQSVTGRRQYILATLKTLVQMKRVGLSGTGVRSDPFLYSVKCRPEGSPYSVWPHTESFKLDTASDDFLEIKV